MTAAAVPTLPADALERACSEIAARWRKFVPEAEAQEQARQFRARCEALAAEGHLNEAELDATLELVADCMGAG